MRDNTARDMRMNNTISTNKPILKTTIVIYM